jgi:hypothetical protein
VFIIELAIDSIHRGKGQSRTPDQFASENRENDSRMACGGGHTDHQSSLIFGHLPSKVSPASSAMTLQDGRSSPINIKKLEHQSFFIWPAKMRDDRAFDQSESQTCTF